MRAVWALTAVLVISTFVSVKADAKKYDPEVHDLKKSVDADAKKDDSAGKAVSDLTNINNLAALNAESKGVLTPIINQLLGAVAPGVALPDPFTTIGIVLTGIFAIKAALAAGLAALVGFILPPLQIVNQVLAIIALALLTAYIVEDKKSGDYYDYDSGYVATGYDMGGYGDTSGYSAPSSGSGSSYTSYRRSDEAKARSNAYRPLVNRVARMVNSAVKKYSEMYD